MTFSVLFTSDYEIHGNGHGSPRQLMVETTDRMLTQFDRFGAKLTIMADVAEIIRFERYAAETGRDDFSSREIRSQLQRAVMSGHDVQLHIHPSYYNSRYVDGHFAQDYTQYDLARLPPDTLKRIVTEGKAWLEQVLRPVKPDYQCIAFRAANWSMNPSRSIADALVASGIPIDTSVFKYGVRRGLVGFDYHSAPSEIVPWRAHRDDICRHDENGALIEIPIYCEHRRLWHFVTLNRIYRVILHRLNPLPRESQDVAGSSGGADPADEGALLRRLTNQVFGRHAWKADFNQCSGSQLVAAARRIERQYGRGGGVLPMVLIGHSKLFTRFNERSLKPFLRFVAERSDRFRFGTFGELDLTALRA